MEINHPLSEFEQQCEKLIDLIRETTPNPGWDSGRSFDLTTLQCVAEIVKFMNKQELYVANVYGSPWAIITKDKFDDYKKLIIDEEYDADDDQAESPEEWVEGIVDFEKFTLNKFE